VFRASARPLPLLLSAPLFLFRKECVAIARRSSRSRKELSLFTSTFRSQILRRPPCTRASPERHCRVDFFCRVHFLLCCRKLIVYSALGTSAYDKTGTKGADCRKFVSTVYSDCADFPQTIEAVYRDGFNVFVEVGPNSHRLVVVFFFGLHLCEITLYE